MDGNGMDRSGGEILLVFRFSGKKSFRNCEGNEMLEMRLFERRKRWIETRNWHAADDPIRRIERVGKTL